VTGLAAYPYKHINSTLRHVAAYVAMEGLGPASKLEHLPQHGDAPFGWRFPQHVDHHARRIGIGVIAIVQNHNAGVLQALAAHGRRRQFLHHVDKLRRANTIQRGDRKARQYVQYAVTPQQGALKCHATHPETDAVIAELHLAGANIGVGLDSKSDRAAGMHIPESRDQRIVRVQHSDTIGGQRFDQFALGPGHSLDGIERLHMRMPDVSHHADARLGNRAQSADLTRVVHPHFEHRDARFAR